MIIQFFLDVEKDMNLVGNHVDIVETKNVGDSALFTCEKFWRYLAYAERYRILGIAIVAPPPKFTIESRHS